MTGNHEFMTPGEVAALFRVDPKTVRRWVLAGKLKAVRTPGGRPLFRTAAVRAFLKGEPEEARDAVKVPPDHGEGKRGQRG